MIKVKLRQAMDKHYTDHGVRLKYSDISAASGLSKATVEAIGSREDYNPTLSTIDRLCEFFNCRIEDLLEFQPTKKHQ